ncbi:response regulator transcription factor [Acetobacter sacchari]|uniref:response regulator transcription factor n=1 Tax=Acetobacter sacchari TaxID=2661687 RepID=UPI001FAFEBE9|nr:response regulator transcription factor [Acetobacter sacchari]
MKILLVDDHAVVRAGLAQLLSASLGAQVFEASDENSALDWLRRCRPELVIVDLGLPGAGGLWLLTRLRDMGLRCLVLSMHAEAIYARRALDAGACGYISKNIDASELLHAVKQASEGRIYVEKPIAEQLSLHSDVLGRDFGKLTARDLDLIRLLSEGKTLSEIAACVDISYKTVANAMSLIKTKLGVSSTADLLRFAMLARPEH